MLDDGRVWRTTEFDLACWHYVNNVRRSNGGTGTLTSFNPVGVAATLPSYHMPDGENSWGTSNDKGHDRNDGFI